MTSNGWPLMRIARPMTFGSAAKRPRQNSSLITDDARARGVIGRLDQPAASCADAERGEVGAVNGLGVEDLRVAVGATDG